MCIGVSMHHPRDAAEIRPTRPNLAIAGGPPVRPVDRPWPAWPRYTDAARREVDALLASRLLLGDDRDMDDVICALRKVWEHLT